MEENKETTNPEKKQEEEEKKTARVPRQQVALLTESAVTHYESKRDFGNEGRSAGRLLFLRTFNNWVKSTLINKYCRRDFSVLDLCCGKGGDIRKWKLARAGHYVGMDISEHAINHAVERYKKYDVRDIFPAIFIKKADVSDEQLDINYLIHHNVQFDIVSCQMSMHYICRSEVSVRAFLRIVTSRLVPGGWFIGTIPDADVLVKKLRHSRAFTDSRGVKHLFTFGNTFYSAKFGQKRFPVSQPFGLQYYFYLEDSVGRKEDERVIYVPEYLVIFDKFVELAAEYDLEFVEKKNFHQFYDEEIHKPFPRRIFYRMVHSKPSDTELDLKEQWDAIYLYMCFAFRKKGDSNHRPHGSCGSREHLKILNAKGWDYTFPLALLYLYFALDCLVSSSCFISRSVHLVAFPTISAMLAYYASLHCLYSHLSLSFMLFLSIVLYSIA